MQKRLIPVNGDGFTGRAFPVVRRDGLRKTIDDFRNMKEF